MVLHPNMIDCLQKAIYKRVIFIKPISTVWFVTLNEQLFIFGGDH